MASSIDTGLIARLRAMQRINTRLSHGCTTVYCQPLNYENSMAAMKLCGEAADALEAMMRVIEGAGGG